ncbi:MAG: TauD/TfdA family dioxygenase [Novosphingobium sp.]
MAEAKAAAMTANDGVTVGDRGLELVLPGAGKSYFNHYWLRDNCSSSFDPETRERVFDIFHLDAPPRPRRAQIVGGELEVVWDGENHVSHYPLDWLEACVAGPRSDPADLVRQPWYGDHFPDVHRVEFAVLKQNAEALKDYLRALLVEGVAFVTAMPDSDEALTELVRMTGHVRPTFFGEYFDVRTHIEPSNLAYTANALELHTDTPAEDLAPGMQFLHCRANSVEGGDNLFLDGMAVAEDLRQQYPEDFRILSETRVTFYCEHDTYDMRARQRVIELDEHGAVSGVTISQHMADVFDLPQRELDAFYPAFCRFGRMLADPRYVMRFNIRPGECIAFDNHRIVHGRDAYSATSGDRYLRGCYSDRGELRSAYRVLAGAGRFK